MRYDDTDYVQEKGTDDFEETARPGNDDQSNTGVSTGTRYPVRKAPSLNLRIIPTFSIFYENLVHH